MPSSAMLRGARRRLEAITRPSHSHANRGLWIFVISDDSTQKAVELDCDGAEREATCALVNVGSLAILIKGYS